MYTGSGEVERVEEDEGERTNDGKGGFWSGGRLHILTRLA